MSQGVAKPFLWVAGHNQTHPFPARRVTLLIPSSFSAATAALHSEVMRTLCSNSRLWHGRPTSCVAQCGAITILKVICTSSNTFHQNSIKMQKISLHKAKAALYVPFTERAQQTCTSINTKMQRCKLAAQHGHTKCNQESLGTYLPHENRFGNVRVRISRKTMEWACRNMPPENP